MYEKKECYKGEVRTKVKRLGGGRQSNENIQWRVTAEHPNMQNGLCKVLEIR